MLERARRDPKVRQIVEDVRLFDGLRDHPGWKRLYDKIRENRDAFMVTLTRRLMAGERVPFDEIAHSRGFYEGALWIIEQPETAERNLERAARVAWLRAQAENDQDEEGMSPYVS